MHTNVRHRLRTLAVPVFAGGIIFALSAPAQSGGEQPAGGGQATQDEKYEELLKKVGELEAKVSAMEKKGKEDELEHLKAAAEEEGQKEEKQEEGKGGEPSFFSAARALQIQNPEISIVGDFVGRLHANGMLSKALEDSEGEAADRTGFEARAVELVIGANLDPYSFAKAVIALEGGQIDIEEGYVTWTGVLPRVSLTLGKFRQQFGILNRWHTHALDQVDLPRSLQVFLGGEGLAQTGLSLHVLLPRLWAHANDLTIQVTTTENDTLFAGEFWTVPSVLAHVKSYYDLTKSTYLEFGLSGLWGFNNRRNYPVVVDETTGETEKGNEPWRSTVLAGADLTISWTPPSQAKYRRFVWRTEFMYLYKETAEGKIHSFGGFTYFDLMASQRVSLGARLDAGQEPGAEDQVKYLQASPYLTFWQSEFVYLRLQYNYLWRSGGHEPEHLVLLQIDWTAGPHRHDKY